MEHNNIFQAKQLELQLIKEQFENNLFNDFKFEKLSGKLKMWYTLEWNDFKKEILKSGEKFNYVTQSNWNHYFNSQKQKVVSLSKEITSFNYTIVSDTTQRG